MEFKNASNNILVVDNSKLFTSILSRRIESDLHLNVHAVHSYSEAKKLVDTYGAEFFIALAGLHLPDSHEGEVVDLMLSKKIPTVVFTGTYSEDIRERYLSKKIIDYVLKEDSHSLDYVVSLIRRIRLNRSIKVMVVDDSWAVREHIAELLHVHQYQVFKACDGVEAMNIISQHPDIKLVITDYSMPNMDGFSLTKQLRASHSKENLAIIGLSAKGSNKLSARFIKIGANDFMIKPFLSEEFYCRVTQNIEMLEYIKASKDAANKDYLTGLYNRRYFFDLGKSLHAAALRGQLKIIVAMIDIDYFKKINDTYGHDAGDIVLQEVSRKLFERFRQTDLVARFGGEEFCVLGTNMDEKNVENIFDDFRKRIEQTEINFGTKKIHVTISVGICEKLMKTLESMITEADTMLYQAKQSGRNIVKVSR